MSTVLLRKESRILISERNSTMHAYHTNFPMFYEGQFESPEKDKDLVITLTFTQLITQRDGQAKDHGEYMGKLLVRLAEIMGIKEVKISVFQLRVEIYPAFSWEEIDCLIEMALVNIYGVDQPDGSFETRHGITWDSAKGTSPISASDSVTGE